MIIPNTFIQQLLERVDIVQLIERDVPLKKAGSNFLGLCPFHQEKTPSFTVSAKKQFFHCFGCGAHGTSITYLMRHRNLGFVAAVNDLAQYCGIDVPKVAGHTRVNYDSLYDCLEAATHFFQQALTTYPEAQAYLKQRHLDSQTQKRFRIGYAPGHRAYQSRELRRALPEIDESQLIRAGLLVRREDHSIIERFRDRLIVPIIDRQSRVIGFGGRSLSGQEPKYLNSPETEVFHKGQEWFGLPQAHDAIRQENTVIIVEGYFDVMALSQAKIANVVAAMGTAISSDQIARLSSMCSRIILCFDGDLAGIKATWRAIERLLPILQDGKIFEIVSLPEGCDPDNLLQQRSIEDVRQFLHRGKRLSEVMLDSVKMDYDGTSESKAAVIRRVAPWLSEISPHTAPIFRNDIMQRIATLVELPVANIIQAAPVSKSRQKSRPRWTSQRKKPQLETTMIRDAMNYPDKIHTILSGGINPNSDDAKCLQWLVDRYDEGNLPDMWAARIMLLQQQGFHKQVEMLMREEVPKLSLETLELDFEFRREKSEIKNQRKQSNDRYHELCKKMREEGLDAHEKEDLKSLLPSFRSLQLSLKTNPSDSISNTTKSEPL